MPSARVITAMAVNAGFLISCRMAKRKSFTLFGTQCLNGIDTRGAARRQQTGEERDSAKQKRDAEHRRHIGRADAEEQTLQQTRESENADKAQTNAHGDQLHSLPNDQPQHVAALRTESKTNSDLLRPLRDRISHHSKNSGGGEQQIEERLLDRPARRGVPESRRRKALRRKEESRLRDKFSDRPL